MSRDIASVMTIVGCVLMGFAIAYDAPIVFGISLVLLVFGGRRLLSEAA